LLDEQKNEDEAAKKRRIDEFLTLLAICNSIIPEYPSGADPEGGNSFGAF